MKRSLIFIFFLLILVRMHGQQVILTPGGYKRISDLQIGSQVIGKDGNINVLLAKRPLGRAWFEDQSLTREFQWYMINGKYKLFYHQSIYTDKILCHVSELKPGDWIFNGKQREKIVSIKKVDSNEEWYKLDISGDHSYISEVALHNASRFWNKQNASANWNATSPTNWGATSGGTGAAAPTSADDVTFDGAGSGGNQSSTINTTFTILSFTITSGYTATLTHNAVLTIAGNVTLGANMTIAGTGALVISATSTITSNGKTWPNNVTFNGASAVKTITGNLVINGLLTVTTNAQVINHSASETLTCGGLNTGAVCSGTCDLILSGGTWSGSVAVQNNLTITGTVTVGNAFYSTGTLTNSGATVTATGTLTLATDQTLNTSGITWNNITCPTNNSTITLNSALTCAGTLTISGINVTFAGSAAFSVNTLSATQVQASVITLVHGLTYTVTNSLSCNSSRTGSIVSFTSDDGTIKANLTLQPTASCNVLAAFTRIDASNGRTINTFSGTITDCININAFGSMKTVSQAFIQ